MFEVSDEAGWQRAEIADNKIVNCYLITVNLKWALLVIVVKCQHAKIANNNIVTL